MPFVIGVLGVDGLNTKGNTIAFREAMAAPASLPEFKGNVAAVETAPFWAEELAAIDQKRAKVKQMAHLLKVKDKNTPNKDGSMDEAQQKETLKKYEAELISPEEATKWTRGASNAGYHYMGCAKTFALMGKAFADANLEMLEGRP
jgi:alpha-galactosidase